MKPKQRLIAIVYLTLLVISMAACGPANIAESPLSEEAETSPMASKIAASPLVHSKCLDTGNVVVVNDVADGKLINIKVNNNNISYDMRGVNVKATPVDHLIDFETAGNICVTGGAAIAKYPSSFTVNWENVKSKYDKGGFHTTHPVSGTTTFDHVYMEAVEDGLTISRDVGNSTQKWVLSDSYMKNIIDDAIENDGYRSGKVSNVLSEGSHHFYSARNDEERAHSLLIEDSVIGFACKPDPRNDGYTGAGACPRNFSTQKMFKLSSLEPSITMRNTVIHYPAIGKTGPKGVCLPSGSYSNVTIVWTVKGMAYPCSAKAGVRVTTDINVYNEARAKWLSQHGCNADGSDCAFLR